MLSKYEAPIFLKVLECIPCSCLPFCFNRNFIEQHYVTLKKANPEFPFLIRECSGVKAKLWARYGKF